MAIAGFAGLGLANSLAFADRFGLANGLALADRFGFANGFSFANRLDLSSRSLALTYMIGLFNTLAAIYVRDCFANVITFANKSGLIVITITIIV
jgi:hypothetical protein